MILFSVKTGQIRLNFKFPDRGLQSQHTHPLQVDTRLTPEDIIRFLLVIAGTVFVVYFSTSVLTYLLLLLMLVLYLRSRDEAFWLVYFLVVTDGFAGFFGLYHVTIPVLPGLPAIEVSQFYILIAFYKAARLKKMQPVFFRRYLEMILIYLIFLILWGILNGLSGGINVYFRIIKLTLPFAMFYAVPRLFPEWEDYTRIFRFLFPVAIIATLTQLVDIVAGITPADMLGIMPLNEEELSDDEMYRGFYNTGVILITMFGALFYLSTRIREFRKWYLYLVSASALSMAFLSATRGWIIGFGMVVVLYFLLIEKINILRATISALIMTLVIIVAMSVPGIREQVQHSGERLMTLEELREGDITAGGSVKRLDVRSPRVMSKWRESPVVGWGFSDATFRYHDSHVGNQSLLLQSGIIGTFLIAALFWIFSLRLFEQSISSQYFNPFRKSMLVFPVFLLGWFIIHSTSGQHFSYSLLPGAAMVQSLFFSMGALVFRESRRISVTNDRREIKRVNIGD